MQQVDPIFKYHCSNLFPSFHTWRQTFWGPSFQEQNWWLANISWNVIWAKDRLGTFGDGIIMAIKVKSQETSFGVGFKPTWKYIKAIIVQCGEKQRAKVAGQTSGPPLKIPNLSVTIPLIVVHINLKHQSRYLWVKNLSRFVQMTTFKIVSQ